MSIDKYVNVFTIKLYIYIHVILAIEIDYKLFLTVFCLFFLLIFIPLCLKRQVLPVLKHQINGTTHYALIYTDFFFLKELWLFKEMTAWRNAKEIPLTVSNPISGKVDCYAFKFGGFQTVYWNLLCIISKCCLKNPC